MTTRQKERPGVMLYFDAVRPAISRLNEAQCGVLLRSVMDYAQYGVVPELDGMTGLAFDMLVPKIDRDGERYEESREQRQYAAYTREKKRNGEPVLSIAEWRLARRMADERDNGPSRPDNGPLPSASTAPPATAAATPAASATASTPIKTSLSAAAAGEGSKGEGEVSRLFAEWLRALDAKDKMTALKLDGQLYALGYQTDIATKELRRRAHTR
ncbi:MAG: hypothetical protein IJQ36_05665 [Oscillospiraceae bacterium]|nr:hypothetical protein [Oscillospiraceae bacterium]